MLRVPWRILQLCQVTKFPEEKVQQLRVRLADHMKVPIGQVAMILASEII